MTLQSDIAKLIVDNHQGLITPQRLRQTLQLLVDANDPSVLLASIEPGLRRLFIGYAQPWQPGKAYTVNELVRNGNQLFVVAQAHTSATGPAGIDAATGLPNALLDDMALGRVFTLGGGTAASTGPTGSGLPRVPTTLFGMAKHIVLGPTENQDIMAHWADDRYRLQIVDRIGDLSSVTALPTGYLKQGTLAYVKDDNRIYEYLPATDNQRTASINDWRPINAAGPKVYNRVANLPQPPTDLVHEGDLAIVRYHQDGRTPLNTLFMARKFGSATLSKPDPAVPIKDDGTALNVTGLTPGNPLSYTMYIQVDPAVDLAAGGYPLYIPTDQKIYVQYSDGQVEEIDIIANTYPDWNTLRATGLRILGTSPHPLGFLALDLSPDDSHTYLSVEAPVIGADFLYRGFQPVGATTNPTPPTFPNRYLWMPAATETYAKALKSDADFTDGYDKDITITTEQGHKQIKLFDNQTQNWITVYDEDTVKEWIAAGNLFTGTVQEAGHGTVGAIDAANMPAQAALGATDKGHYWVWVGTPGHALVASELGGAPSAIDGQVLNVGDWIQVSEPTPRTYSYSVIPGDLLSKGTALSLFGMNTWVQGAYQTGTIILYQGDLYKTSVPVLATDPAPNDPANTKWVKVPISGGVRSVATDTGLPAAAPNGALYLVINSAQANNEPGLFSYDQPTGQWKQIGGAESHALDLTGGTRINNIGVPIGTVISYAGQTAPKGWLVCDGSAFDGFLYPQLTATLGGLNKTPDLTGQFIRGGTPEAGFTKHRWTTGRPRSLFTTGGGGNHKHIFDRFYWDGGLGHSSSSNFPGGVDNYAGGSWGKNNRNTSNAGIHDSGSHVHAVTGGGDSETAPDHVILMYLIKADDIGMFGGTT